MRATTSCSETTLWSFEQNPITNISESELSQLLGKEADACIGQDISLESVKGW